jgi:N-methylhydantoinase B
MRRAVSPPICQISSCIAPCFTPAAAEDRGWVYDFWDFPDDDMVTGIPVRVRLRMTVSDGLIDLDMSGSDPQVRFACNVPTMGRRTYWLTTVLTTFDPLMPHNAGMYRGITVQVPRGSVLRAEFPDAVSVRNSVPYRLFDCIYHAGGA